jgi:hypothetical protein
LHQRGERRFRQLDLTFAEYAHLEALQAVVGQARSGDLEIDLPGQTRPVSAEEVIASYRRQGRYLSAAVLRDVLRAEATEPGPAVMLEKAKD